jgi:glutathione S-transferase
MDRHLADRAWLAGDDYTIAEIARLSTPQDSWTLLAPGE